MRIVLYVLEYFKSHHPQLVLLSMRLLVMHTSFGCVPIVDNFISTHFLFLKLPQGAFSKNMYSMIDVLYYYSIFTQDICVEKSTRRENSICDSTEYSQ